MSCSLELALDRAEGALLRVLGTIERRGWNLVTVSAASGPNVYAVKVTLDGARDPEILCRQLERLVDVQNVRLLAAEV
ncbi:ACT domain-containing protein [Tahibacter amnicola]|uniref:ACT domain-containing protein n=1 Tax=Tahibacter amnicola TaxID=2976241 RepID=A0ABY6BG16_9GAMM|nr:ACT domain-containing protein [Tahibacter amnicola]UXI68775.1 ACT domain-containing protein [Tahibacter amnicola]